MLHMDNVETPSSFALPNDEAPSFVLPNDEVQGGMQDTVQGGMQDTQGGMQDTQSGMQRDERSQWDFQRDMSINDMLESFELQGGMQDTREKRLYLPEKYGRPALPPSPKRKHVRWYQTRK